MHAARPRTMTTGIRARERRWRAMRRRVALRCRSVIGRRARAQPLDGRDCRLRRRSRWTRTASGALGEIVEGVENFGCGPLAVAIVARDLGEDPLRLEVADGGVRVGRRDVELALDQRRVD